ncbi:hypothetical protein N7452_009437 [Penicillium brevicompactum]|uniref:Uncharacterized protein n=1 Tax=Penicillium brevicompactum TaxID=5074 RepID=A0A9W9QD77_PENBR|nr:hypothetical protein N7452_009437 [Penicillium brevicompactum]
MKAVKKGGIRPSRGSDRSKSSIQSDEYLRKIRNWDQFEYNARKHYLKTQLSGNVLGYTGPGGAFEMSSNEVFLCGDESSVVARFGQNVGHVMTKVFQTDRSQDNSLRDISFGDYRALREDKSSAKCPDIAIGKKEVTGKKEAIGKKRELLCVGEAKTPWSVDLDGIKYADKNGVPFRRLLGQISGYMNQLNLKYGFLTTYEKTIFLKRETHPDFKAQTHNLVLWHSPAIYHNTPSQAVPENQIHAIEYMKKVSLRECFLYFVSLAQVETFAGNKEELAHYVGPGTGRYSANDELTEPSTGGDPGNGDNDNHGMAGTFS